MKEQRGHQEFTPGDSTREYLGLEKINHDVLGDMIILRHLPLFWGIKHIFKSAQYSGDEVLQTYQTLLRLGTICWDNAQGCYVYRNRIGPGHLINTQIQTAYPAHYTTRHQEAVDYNITTIQIISEQEFEPGQRISDKRERGIEAIYHILGWLGCSIRAGEISVEEAQEKLRKKLEILREVGIDNRLGESLYNDDLFFAGQFFAGFSQEVRKDINEISLLEIMKELDLAIVEDLEKSRQRWTK